MSSLKILVPILIIFCCLSISLAATEIRDMQVKVIITSPEQYEIFYEMHPDILGVYAEGIVILTNKEELEQLKAHGIITEVMHESLSEFYQKRAAASKDDGVGSMNGFRTLEEVYTYLDGLIASYSSIISDKQIIGYSQEEGLPIYAVKVSNNHDLDEDEPEILYTAAIHAREVITPEVLLQYMTYLAENYSEPDIEYLVNNREMWFIVVVNPEGYNYLQVNSNWRKNLHDNNDNDEIDIADGVDINRNFGYKWAFDDWGSSGGPDGYSSDDYRGDGPFSEKETQALRDFISDHDFSITMYFHSYGNLFMSPWGYIMRRTPDQEIFARMGDSVATYSGGEYYPCLASELYVVNGDSDDWGYAEIENKNRNLAVSIEVGRGDFHPLGSDGFWPEPDRIQPLVEQNIEPCLFLARIAGNESILKSPEKTTIAVPTNSNSAEYTVEWPVVENAVKYELVEMQNLSLSLDPVENASNWITRGFWLQDDISHSATYSFACDTFNGNHYIQSVDPITVTEGMELTFYMYYDWWGTRDYACVEISTDGKEYFSIPGNVTEEMVLDPDDDTYYAVHAISEQPTEWVQGAFNLSDYAGQDIFIRISYYCQQPKFWSGPNFYVDDIEPVQSYGPETVLASHITDTFYTIYDRPIGDYYYKVCAIDAQGQKAPYSNAGKTFVYGYDYICGDVNYDQVVDQADIDYLMAFIFQGGPEPIPLESGEVNCDGDVNVGDVVYLVNYIHKGGPAPCDCSKNLVDNIAAADNRISLHPELQGQRTVFNLYTSEKLAGVRISLPADSKNNGMVLLDERFRLFENAAHGIVNLGFIIDGKDTKMIKPGKYPLFSVPGEVRVIEALAVAAADRTVEIALEDFEHKEIVENDLQSSLKCFPNPFNATTEISFSLSQRSRVSLEIFNILGRKVTTLADDYYEAGSHSVTWDASHVASGIYLYRIKAGDFVETKTMTLLK